MTPAAALLLASLLQARADVPDVSLEGLDPAVAVQLRNVRHRLDAAQRAGGASAALFGDAGRHYHAYGMIAPAEACYRKAEALAREDYRWPYLLAVVQQEAGRVEEAAASLGRALAAQRYYPALLRLAALALVLGRPDEAQRWLAPARAHAPTDPALLSVEGEVALAQARPAEAVAALEEALRREPRASRLHHLLGMAYRDLGRADEARAHLAQAGAVGVRAQDPLLDEVRSLRHGESSFMIEGHQAFRAGDFAGAAAAFAGAVEASGGSSVGPLLNLAAAEERLGRLEGALGHLEQARRLEPSHPLVLFNLGTLRARSGRPAEAEPLLAELVKRSPADAEARSEWGLALVALGRLDDAERAFSTVNLDEARCRRLREALAARPLSGLATGGAVAALGRRASACH